MLVSGDFAFAFAFHFNMPSYSFRFVYVAIARQIKFITESNIYQFRSS